jgi:hypothetical protein
MSKIIIQGSQQPSWILYPPKVVSAASVSDWDDGIVAVSFSDTHCVRQEQIKVRIFQWIKDSGIWVEDYDKDVRGIWFHMNGTWLLIEDARQLWANLRKDGYGFYPQST